MKNKFLYPFLFLALVSCGEKEDDVYDPLDELRNKKVSGTVTYSDGSAACGVVVSDGYTCVLTDAKGKYEFEKNSDAYYIWYSIPSDAAVQTGDNGLPLFYKKIITGTRQYDFTLTRQAVETDFRLLGVGDIQVKTAAHINRFAKETAEDLREFKAKHSDMPVYAIHLGDLVANVWSLYPDIIPQISASTTGIPMFQTIGNHDHVFQSANNIASQRTYESYLGPVNYSFNRGDVHIVVMDDIIHSAEESSKYDGGFLPWQYEWLKQDLSYVDKDKSIVLAVHIPFRTAFYNNYKLGDDTGCYWSETLALIAQFKSAKIISGHIHAINNTYVHNVSGKTIQEYALGASCGAHWSGTCCLDGAPNGYAVMQYNGAELKNYTYKATKRDESYQMRIYLASDFPDFTYDSMSCKWGLVTLDKTYVVNIWNMTDEWKTEVFLDGVSYGSLKRKNFADAAMIHYLYESRQYSLIDSAIADRYHMYYFRPYGYVSSFKEMKVVATDPFGNKYECSTITPPSSSEFYSY